MAWSKIPYFAEQGNANVPAGNAKVTEQTQYDGTDIIYCATTEALAGLGHKPNAAHEQPDHCDQWLPSPPGRRSYVGKHKITLLNLG